MAAAQSSFVTLTNSYLTRNHRGDVGGAMAPPPKLMSLLFHHQETAPDRFKTEWHKRKHSWNMFAHMDAPRLKVLTTPRVNEPLIQGAGGRRGRTKFVLPLLREVSAPQECTRSIAAGMMAREEQVSPRISSALSAPLPGVAC